MSISSCKNDHLLQSNAKHLTIKRMVLSTRFEQHVHRAHSRYLAIVHSQGMLHRRAGDHTAFVPTNATFQRYELIILDPKGILSSMLS